MTTKLTPAQNRAVLALHAAAGLVPPPAVPIRPDVLARLRVAGLVAGGRVGPALLTPDGVKVAEALAAQTPIPPAQTAADGRTDLVGVLVSSAPAAWPTGAGDALVRALGPMDDRQRVEFLTFLAAPAGAAWLGAVKDEIVVANRPGRTYPQTAEALGLSVTAVNKAVSRRALRRPTLPA